MKEHAMDQAIGMSLLLHALVLVLAIGINFPAWQKTVKRQRMVEVSYRQVNQHPVDVKERPIKPAQDIDFSHQRIQANVQKIPVVLTKSKGDLPAGLIMEGKPERWRSLSTSRQKITITSSSSEKINNPAYAAYGEMVRSRIKERVTANFDRNLDRTEGGKVYLTFVVTRTGQLRASQIIQDKTQASAYLQDISLRSLSQASPFPPVLKGMTLPEYTYNIEVQYQVSE